MKWDTNSVDERLKAQLRSEELRLKEIREYKPGTPTYDLMHDECLARIEILNFIEGRTFLVSAEALVEALRYRKKLGPVCGRQSRNRERYSDLIQNAIDEFINRFEANA